MNKTRKLLKAMAAILRQPSLLNLVIDDQANWKKEAYRQYGKNCEFITVPFTLLAGEKPDPVYPYAFLEGGSLPTDLALLQSLAKQYPRCRYFEIGTWRGESVACVAAVADRCVTVNLSERQITEAGYPEAYADAHFYYSKALPNVKQIREDAASFSFESLGEKFDLVFIDGDHHYDAILRDTSRVFDQLLHPGSMVVWHDYALNPELVRYETLAAILGAVPPELHRNLYHVSNSKCAVYSPRPLQGKLLTWPHRPGGAFSVSLTWHPEKEG